MKKFIVSVTEEISHSYEVEAHDKESAINAYYKLTDDELKSKDLDGNRSWDIPWDVCETEG